MMVMLERTEIEQFRTLVAQRLGLMFDDTKLDMLADVIRQRLEGLKCGDTFSYFRRLSPFANDAGELRILAQLLTVNETYFFRNPDHFAAFTARILPAFNARGGSREIRILSAGCASGEEAYTLAILMHERSAEFPNLTARITGIDINPVMIQKAAQARYSNWALRGTKNETRDHYFKPEGKDFRLNENMKSTVSFHERNLIADDARFWRPQAFDVVFCRNVIMYFPPELAREVIERIKRSMTPGGFLFLGHAETLRGLSHDFHLCHTDGTFYYQLRDASSAHPAAAESGAEWEHASSAPLVPLVEESNSWVEAIQRASDRIHLLSNDPGVSQSAGSSAMAVPQQPPAAKAPGRRWDLSLALELMRNEQYAQALQQLNSLPAESRGDPDVQLLHAVLLTNAGDLAGAEKVCAQLLEIDELNVGAHYLMALCREHAHDVKAATEHDQVATYLDSAFAMPHLHLGLMARRSGDPDRARREFEAARALLEREDPSRIILFGGGFTREALVALCRAELTALGGIA